MFPACTTCMTCSLAYGIVVVSPHNNKTISRIAPHHKTTHRTRIEQASGFRAGLLNGERLLSVLATSTHSLHTCSRPWSSFILTAEMLCALQVYNVLCGSEFLTELTH